MYYVSEHPRGMGLERRRLSSTTSVRPGAIQYCLTTSLTCVRVSQAPSCSPSDLHAFTLLIRQSHATESRHARTHARTERRLEIARTYNARNARRAKVRACARVRRQDRCSWPTHRGMTAHFGRTHRMRMWVVWSSHSPPPSPSTPWRDWAQV